MRTAAPISTSPAQGDAPAILIHRSSVGVPRPHQQKRPRLTERLDLPLLSIVGCLCGVGLLAIASTTGAAAGDTGFVVRQAVFLMVGLAAMTVVIGVDYRNLRPLTPALIGATVVLLLAVLSPLGTTVKGTRAWFRFGPIAIQPAEFAKLAVIVGLAVILSNAPKRRRRQRNTAPSLDPARIALALSLIGLIVVLVLAERETGSVFVYCFIAMGVFWVAGAPGRIIALLAVSGVAVFALAFSTGVLEDHQMNRLTSFLDADADPQGSGYNQRQSVTAIGSGGLLGQGVFEGPQTQFGFLPEKQTDFIFAAVGEETGFVGSLALLLLHGALLWRIFLIGRDASDAFGSLICFGVFTMMLVQVVQNTGMTVRLLPITGIPLPFVSYGGSSLLTSLLAIGLVLSVAAHRQDQRIVVSRSH